MFCEKCGFKNTDNAVFCENCGAPLQGKSESKPVKLNTNVIQKQHNPISKLTIVIVAELIITVLLVYLVYGFGKNYFGPEHRAEEFFEYMANAEWDKAYEMLDIDESTFINKHSYETANRNLSFDNIVNYKIDKDTDVKGEQLSKKINIKYSVKDAGDSMYYNVTLNKDAKKKLYLFDDWSINSAQYICKDFKIYVPDGATVVFDGVTIGDDYLYSDFEKMDSGITAYLIPKLFSGCHDIKITKEGMEDVSEIITVDVSGSQYELDKMRLNDDTVETIEKQAYENMKNIYSAALNNQDFSSIQELFTKDKDKLDSIKTLYNYLVYNLNSDDFSTYKITMKSINENLKDDETIMVNFEISYIAEFKYLDYSYDAFFNDDLKSSVDIGMEFVNEDGKWVQTNLGCTYLMFLY